MQGRPSCCLIVSHCHFYMAINWHSKNVDSIIILLSRASLIHAQEQSNCASFFLWLRAKMSTENYKNFIYLANNKKISKFIADYSWKTEKNSFLTWITKCLAINCFIIALDYTIFFVGYKYECLEVFFVHINIYDYDSILWLFSLIISFGEGLFARLFGGVVR